MSKNCLAKQVFDEQKVNNWPGLVAEVKQLCKDLSLPDITESHNKFKKLDWKYKVGVACKVEEENCLKNEMSKLSKVEDIKDEIFELKGYLKEMTLQQTRMHFKIRTQMTNCKMNYSNDMKNRESLWRCESCQTNIDTQKHVLFCPAYKKLREGKSLENDMDVVNYFIEVMKIREKLDLIR